MKEVKCRICDRFLAKAVEGIFEIPCPNCGATTQVKLVSNEASLKSLAYKFENEPKEPKEKFKKKEKNAL